MITLKTAIKGSVPVISSGQQPSFYHNCANRNGETIVVAGSGAYAGFVSYWDTPIFVADAFSVSPKNLQTIIVKYLFYYLQNNQETIYHTKTTGGIPHVYSRFIENYIIPIPPKHIQQQIVNQLDTFTTLIAKLESELTLRQKQYEFYREKLLNFDGDEEVEWKTMKEVFNIRNGYTPSKSNKAYWEGGTIPWFRVEDIRTNGRLLSESSLHINPEGVKGELFPANSIILSTSATIGEHALLLVDCLANQRFICLTINDKYKDKLLEKFVFYYMFKVDEWCVNNTNIAGFASVDMSKFYTLCFPIPKDQHRQQQIVSQLDTFEQLIAALKREIALRQKQYEFYREKLLTFE